MNTDKIAELIRQDPVPWHDLRERRVFTDIQLQITKSRTQSKTMVLQTPLGNPLHYKVILTAAATLLVGLGVFIGAQLFAPSPESLTSDDTARNVDGAPVADFDSTLEINGVGNAVLSPGARLMLQSENANEIHMSQTIGRIHYAILPQRNRTLFVHIRQIEVRVIGTAFDIDMNNNAVVISVSKGVVSVVDGKKQFFLGARERYQTQFETLQHKKSETEMAPSPAHTATDIEYQKNINTKNKGKPKKIQPQKDEKKSRATGLTDARSQEPAMNETPDSDTSAPQIEDILKNVDLARRHGNFAHAKELLLQAIQTYPDDAKIPVCYFTLGNVAYSSGRYLDAARSYRQYLLVAPDGNLSEDALAAIADSLTQAGQIRSAADAAQRYIETYPNGIHAQRMKALAQ
ncbi:MAG: FecR domain-containing protein [Deltaproteobacteria bacterium]|nr:FecR domain-containing protein [Deltaproteobacteria bacterium]